MKCGLPLAAVLNILAILICVASVTAAGVYTDCGTNKLATIENIEVTDCDGSQEECTLKRNSNVTITIDFVTKNPISKVNTVVHGIFQSMAVPHMIINPDACKSSGLTCPLKGNAKHHYVAVMAVLKAYPRLKVDVKWELLNENHENIVCLMIPAVIK